MQAIYARTMSVTKASLEKDKYETYIKYGSRRLGYIQ